MFNNVKSKKGFGENFIVISSGEWVGMFDFKARLLAQMQVDEKTLEFMRKKRQREEEGEEK
jgi:hypothetical protein